MDLELVDTLGYIFVLFVLYFGLGYLLLQNRLGSVPFGIAVPLILSLGLLILTISLSLIGLFYIGNWSILGLFILPYSIIITRIIKDRGSILRSLKNFLRLQPLQSVVPLVSLSLVVIIFSIISSYLGWPPAGDASVHGFLTSLLVHNNALQINLEPIAPSHPWLEPFGFHIVAANLSELFDILPGTSILSLASTVVILMPMLIYSITYLLTRSIVFSVLALLSGFYISSIPNLEYWPMGYFYNGTYANLFGFLAVLTYVSVEFGIPQLEERRWQAHIPSLVSLLGTVIIYPPMAILPIIHLVGTAITNGIICLKRKQIRRGFNHNLSRKFYVFFSMIVIFLTILIGVVITNGGDYSIASRIFGSISLMISRVANASFNFSLSPNSFLSDLTGPLTILVMSMAVISLAKRKLIYISSFYVLISIVSLLSIWEATSKYLWFVLPRRLFIVLIILDWIMLLTYIHLLISWFDQRFKTRMFAVRGFVFAKKYFLYVIILIPFGLIFTPQIISHVNLDEANRWSAWFSRSDSFGNDYNILAWTAGNINSEDLIMVQPSRTSSYLYSFSLLNLTAPIISDSQYQMGRSLKNLIAWERPELLRDFVNTYNVTYILVLSDFGHYNPRNLGGDGLYYPSKYASSSLIEKYDGIGFLEPIKRYKGSALYKVAEE